MGNQPLKTDTPSDENENSSSEAINFFQIVTSFFNQPFTSFFSQPSNPKIIVEYTPQSGTPLKSEEIFPGLPLLPFDVIRIIFLFAESDIWNLRLVCQDWHQAIKAINCRFKIDDSTPIELPKGVISHLRISIPGKGYPDEIQLKKLKDNANTLFKQLSQHVNSKTEIELLNFPDGLIPCIAPMVFLKYLKLKTIRFLDTRCCLMCLKDLPFAELNLDLSCTLPEEDTLFVLKPPLNIKSFYYKSECNIINQHMFLDYCESLTEIKVEFPETEKRQRVLMILKREKDLETPNSQKKQSFVIKIDSERPMQFRCLSNSIYSLEILNDGGVKKCYKISPHNRTRSLQAKYSETGEFLELVPAGDVLDSGVGVELIDGPK